MQYEISQKAGNFLFKTRCAIFLMIVAVVGCSTPAANQKIEQSATMPDKSFQASNIAVVTPDSVPYKPKEERESEAIILEKIRNDWTDDEGNTYKLTEPSERKMLEVLLPEAEKQYMLSFYAQNTKLSEDITESNIETTITEIGNTKTVTKRKLFSKGAEKISAALENIEEVSANIGQNLDNLNLIPKNTENARSNKVTANGREIAYEILMTVHKSALTYSDEIYQPMIERKQNLHKAD